MEERTLAMPGYKVCEYLLVIAPHEELWNKIQTVKQEFAEKYKSNNARWGKPNLHLATFVQYEMIEERLINRLNAVGMRYPPFKVELKDFGSFPTHNIHIKVTSKVGIQGLVKSIRSDAQKLMKLDDDNKPYFNMEPNFTIGRKLTPSQYEKGWEEYSHKHFTGRFIASEMVLVKRPVGNMQYQFVQRFQFQNLPVSTKQGELFN